MIEEQCRRATPLAHQCGSTTSQVCLQRALRKTPNRHNAFFRPLAKQPNESRVDEIVEIEVHHFANSRAGGIKKFEKCAIALGVPAPILMLDTEDLAALMVHLLEVHEVEDVLLAISQAIAERRGCATVPPAL